MKACPTYAEQVSILLPLFLEATLPLYHDNFGRHNDSPLDDFKHWFFLHGLSQKDLE